MAIIDSNSEEISRKLKQLADQVDNLRPALLDIGEFLVESTKERFNSGIGPDGIPWPENSPVTVDRKGRNQPLIGEGSLMEQISYAIIGGDTLEVGSSMEYAAMQQFGGTKSEFPWLWGDIPARPFLGISTDDEREILGMLEEHILGKF